MLVRKILENTLTAGSSTVTFNDSDIPNSLLRLYSTDDSLFPVSTSLSGNILTVTYDVQESTKYIALEIVKQGLDIINDLTSTDADKALSAAQGKALKDLIDGITVTGSLSDLDDVNIADPATDDILIYDGTEEEWINTAMPNIPSNIDDLSDVEITSPTNGQVLTYYNGEWINSNTSDGGTNYSSSGTVVGKWIDNSDVILKVYPVNTSKTYTYNQWNSTGITDSNIKMVIDAIICDYDSNNSATTYLPVVAQYYNNDLNIWLTRERNTTLAANHYIILTYVKA